MNGLIKNPDYFPMNPQIWGRGKVLITTRDQTISNLPLFSNTHIIEVPELNPQEKYMLFTKIILKNKKFNLTVEEGKKIKKFLDHIPPFPLDVSTAAHYIMMSKVSYEDYLHRLRSYKGDFPSVQGNILEDVNSNISARYSIITFSIKDILDKNSNFITPFLLVGLLNNTNIPKDFINLRKDIFIIDELLHFLRKQSLIIEPLTKNKIPTFSIHKSTQEILRTYLLKILPLEEKLKFTKDIGRAFENYIQEVLAKDDLIKMKLLKEHLITFLSYESLIDDITRADLFVSLAAIYLRGNVDYEKAKYYLKEGLKIYEKKENSPKSKISEAFLSLSIIYKYLGNVKEEEKYLNQSLMKAIQHYGDENKPEIGRIFVHLGNHYRRATDYEKAEKMLQKSLTIYTKCYGENHSLVGWVLGNIGRFYKQIGDYTRAHNFIEKSINLQKKELGDAHIEISWLRANLAIIYNQRNNYAKAKEIFEREIRIHKEHYGENNPEFAWMSIHLCMTYGYLGNWAGAKKCVENNLHFYRNNYGDDHAETAWAYVQLGKVHQGLKNYKEALFFYKKGLTIYKNLYGPFSLSYGKTLSLMGEAYFLDHDYQEAQKLLQEALSILEKFNHPKKETVINMLKNIKFKELSKGG